MANPLTGEVSLVLDGERRIAKLTLGALAELEDALGEVSLVEVVERFEAGRHRSSDVLALVVAGLRGGGWRGSAEDLLSADIQGGPLEASRVAASLLVAAFSPVSEGA
ncbi:MAG: gene transfer agent family protein [Pseudomonadota bacterium]